jgi:RNA polymerase sigma-70 factor (ECF subfamily)
VAVLCRQTGLSLSILTSSRHFALIFWTPARKPSRKDKKAGRLRPASPAVLGRAVAENGRKCFHIASHSLVVPLSDREISAEIIESCRAGDRDAFRVLYDLYKDRVFSVSLYFFHGDEAVASDVTQQVFLKLITTISQFRGDAAFSTWLYRLVVNACQDTARRRKSAVLTTDRSRLEEVSILGSQEDDYARAQMARSVRAAVSALPPKFRIAVLLRYFDDLSYEQMAEVLHCSMGTVASRLSRSHKILAERLSGLIGTKA